MNAKGPPSKDTEKVINNFIVWHEINEIYYLDFNQKEKGWQPH